MDLIERLQGWLFQGLVKASGLAVAPPWVTTSFQEPSFRSLVTEGYQQNGAVFGCISALAFGFPEPPVVVANLKDEAVPEHPLRQLLNNPNPLMGEPELMYYTIIYTAIGGNAYWHKVRSGSRRVVQLWPYHAGHILPVPGGANWISHYTYDPGTGQRILVPPEDIVHFKWPAVDAYQPWMAMAPLRAVARDVDSDNEIIRYLFALLKNDAVPRTVLTLPAGATLERAARRRLKRDWNQKFSGTGRGSTAVLEGGMDIKRVGLDLKELEFQALHDVPERRICAAFKVPPVVAGLGDDPTFSNSEAAYTRFTHSTLAMLWRLAAGEIQSALGSDFGGNIRVHHDLSKVQALVEDQNKLWNRVHQGVSGQYVMVNEGRAALGLPPDARGDVFLRTLAVIPEPAQPVKGLQLKQSRAAVRVAQTLQTVRGTTARKMEKELDRYFDALAERVVRRASKSLDGNIRHAPLSASGVLALERKVQAGDLLTDGDNRELSALIRKFQADIISASWETWNTALGVVVDFTLDDPTVTSILATSGQRVRDIQGTTLEHIRSALQHGAEQGWSIDQIVDGDEDTPGLRHVVEQTYRNRGRAIARTELGTAQQQAAVMRYGDAGIKHVLVLDNGQEDPDTECAAANGQTWTLAKAESSPLQHPNCTRAFAPVVGE